MPFAEGCETMSMSGKRDGRPLLYARDETEAKRIYYYILWPNLIVSVHPDYVLTHQAWPDGPNRSTVNCDLYVEADKLGTIDISGATEFWDITNREDYHVVEMQQQGTQSRSWVAGRYSNQEASVHAFDIMVADRYVNDGSRTIRGWRTESASDRRKVTRHPRPGPAGRGRRLGQLIAIARCPACRGGRSSRGDAGHQPSGAFGFQGPSMIVASLSPGQRGMVTQMNWSGSTPVQRYWNAVPTGMSMETPVSRTVVSSPVASRRQICPSPERTCQNSLTVAWTVARFT